MFKLPFVMRKTLDDQTKRNDVIEAKLTQVKQRLVEAHDEIDRLENDRKTDDIHRKPCN